MARGGGGGGVATKAKKKRELKGRKCSRRKKRGDEMRNRDLRIIRLSSSCSRAKCGRWMIGKPSKPLPPNPHCPLLPPLLKTPPANIPPLRTTPPLPPKNPSRTQQILFSLFLFFSLFPLPLFSSSLLSPPAHKSQNPVCYLLTSAAAFPFQASNLRDATYLVQTKNIFLIHVRVLRLSSPRKKNQYV